MWFRTPAALEARATFPLGEKPGALLPIGSDRRLGKRRTLHLGHFIHVRNELTKNADCLLQPDCGVPDEPALRVSQGIGPIERVTAAAPSRPHAVSILVGLCHPLMPITAVTARGIEIVQH